MPKYENRLVVITRATRLAKVLESQNTIAQARFYINQLGGDFNDYDTEHKQYNISLSLVRRSLENLGKLLLLDRQFLPSFIFAPTDIVVAVGQDGLVANVIKYLDGQPVIGINPDNARWDGVLLPFTPENASAIVEETILGKRKHQEVSMARARVQNGQELLAVNDFFVGQKSHVSARYVLKYNGLKENQSSSGVIISTGLGSTGWMKSIIAGASRVSTSVIGRPYGTKQESDELTEIDEKDFLDENACFKEENQNIDLSQASRAIPIKLQLPKHEIMSKSMTIPKSFRKMAILDNKKKVYGPTELSGIMGKWSSQELIFAVREPFPSKTTGTNLIFGTVSEEKPLRIESLMGENGVIFSDGLETDFISFNYGTEVMITLASKRGRIVV